MKGYRDGKPCVYCDVCHMPIKFRNKNIEEPRDSRQITLCKQKRTLDVHPDCKSKARFVPESKHAVPEDPADGQKKGTA